MRERQNQFAQRFHAHDRIAGSAHLSANAGVKHPRGDLDRTRVEIRRQTTANERPIFHRPRAVNPYSPTEPRMPAVANFQRLGTMGVLLLACTTRAGCTRR